MVARKDRGRPDVTSPWQRGEVGRNRQERQIRRGGQTHAHRRRRQGMRVEEGERQRVIHRTPPE